MHDIPDDRVHQANALDMNPDGEFVLYWMIANRRTRYNFSLQRARDLAKKLNRPLVILEALRCDYRWNCDRFHWFILQGMRDNQRTLAEYPVNYYPYVERKVGGGKGLLRELASRACAVVTDDFPCFFLPRMTKAAASQIPVRFELVDSNGLYPMRATEKIFARAFDFRRHLQKHLLPHLAEIPQVNPLARIRLPEYELPQSIVKRWQPADLHPFESGDTNQLDAFPVDHSVPPAPFKGGAQAAKKQLANFIRSRLNNYDQTRNQPEMDGTSGLSPYLHFGQISAHDVFEHIARHTGWSPDRVANHAKGSAKGWWGIAESVESFLDELITWRELGYNMCAHKTDYDRYESLPDWARETLQEHANDERPYIYSLEDFESANTHDSLWNAAQTQLVKEGTIHGYLRMLWGKKILHWTSSPQKAMEIMIQLNNKYALDGRNPNSYSGIFWVLGRYDRPWGPERPVFGKVRYMTSKNTARKLNVDKYIEQYS